VSKFKHSTHVLIDQTVKECLYPKIEAGKTYYFSEYGKDSDNMVERPVIEVTDKTVTYLKKGEQKTCDLNTFRRLYDKHGYAVCP
jgi:hypothetical protein